MTSKCAMAILFLKGTVLNVRNCFDLVGLTNCAREASRLIEGPFGVKLDRKPQEGKNRFGEPVMWFNYKLPYTEENLPGIERMREYIKKEMIKQPPKTDEQVRMLKQLKLF